MTVEQNEENIIFGIDFLSGETFGYGIEEFWLRERIIITNLR